MSIRGIRFALRLGAAACALAAFAAPALPAVVCTGAVQHPIAARVEALDVVRRGATVRLRVTATSAVGVARAEARLVRAGAARVVGSNRAVLGSLHARDAREAIFRVVVPASGERALVEFKIEAEGPNGRLVRGAVYNLLPDGPTEVVRTATAGDGTRVLEVEARTVRP
jgi:hypothetical protein